MKSMMLALSFVLSTMLSANASTADSYSLPLVNNDPQVNFTLNTVQTRTEYRNESVAKTCYRTEFDGYRNVCQYYPETYCYEDRMSRRICETRSVYRCHSEPVYRTVPYTCYETVRVPYEVFSHNVKSNVTVNKSADINLNNCELRFTQVGDSLRAEASCGSHLIFAKKVANERREGNTLIQDSIYNLTFANTAEVTAPVSKGISNMRVEGQSLVFSTGDLTKSQFSLKLFAERRKFLRDDETLIDRVLNPGEFSFLNGEVRIDLSKLFGGINSKKKHVFKVNIDVLVDRSAILNSVQPSFSANNSLTINE